MKYKIEWNELYEERYKLCFLRLHAIVEGEEETAKYGTFFRAEAEFLLKMEELEEICRLNLHKSYTLEQLEELNSSLYEELLPEKYDTCYGNPEYTTALYGEEIGRLFSFLYSELRGVIVYAYEKRKYEMLIFTELFLEIYTNFMEEERIAYTESLAAVRYFMSDYSDYLVGHRVSELVNPSHNFAVEVIEQSDLTSPHYLYYFGEYISENERKIAKFLSSLGEEQIEAMARTYTEGFRKGFEQNNIDLSKKKSVNIRYSIGFERMVKAAILQFREMGLEPIIYRSAVSSINRKGHSKVGYFSTSVNRQYDYDHRFDEALYLNRSMITKKLQHARVAYEAFAQQAKEMAGPAVIEIFGETPYEPISKPSALSFTEKQQVLVREYQRESALLVNEFLPREEFSFTIIAYPIPEIGPKFEDIFADTVKVNTLDTKQYEEIQQAMIDVLDQGEAVHIVGSRGNKTDLMIKLQELTNPEKETKFENCLADVNIPVGEVFTSPKLKGTTGHFHVTECYLNELRYIDLELDFKDGMIVSYTCKNFKEEEENKRFVKENLLYHQDTLPMGEFAIGTNTYAYAMGKKYCISHLLPILIAEKTGPHFAVGDTCYKMSEEIRVFNPNGKEIIAKDNECSILRKTKVEEAYYNCHTDITIPYDELEEITVLSKEGEKTSIIQNGKFVLEGTTALNVPLESDL